MQEEQERELSPEIEQERQVQKPAPAKPASHRIHPDVLTFVATRILIYGSKAYKPAFETLRNTSAATHLDVSQFAKGLLVTGDFASTVQIVSASYISDMYQRPIQWILTNTAGTSLSNNIVEHMMIISPYNAQGLLSLIQKSKTVSLYLYAPRPNLGFHTLDGLDLYNVPARPGSRTLSRRLILQLGVFAGQLYLGSFMEYVEMCEFLGLAWEKAEEGCVVSPDGFIMRDGTSQEAFKSGFSTSPIKFLKVFMTKIRKRIARELTRLIWGRYWIVGCFVGLISGSQKIGFSRTPAKRRYLLCFLKHPSLAQSFRRFRHLPCLWPDITIGVLYKFLGAHFDEVRVTS